MTQIDPKMRAKSDALRLLSFKPRSVEELRLRLQMKKYDAPVIEEVLESFKRQGLLDDEKYAKLLVNSRMYSKPAGKKSLEVELRRKKVAEPVITKALSGVSAYDEKEAALEIARKRFGKMTGISDEKKKARLFGFLKRRGFGTDAIFVVLNELMKGSNEE